MFAYPKDVSKKISGINLYAIHDPGMLHLYKNSRKENPSPIALAYDANDWRNSFWMQHRSFKNRDATANLKYVCRSPDTHSVVYLRWTESVNNHLTVLTTHQPVWLVCTEIAHPRQMTHKHHVFLSQHRRTLHRWRCNFLKC